VQCSAVQCVNNNNIIVVVAPDETLHTTYTNFQGPESDGCDKKESADWGKSYRAASDREKRRSSDETGRGARPRPSEMDTTVCKPSVYGSQRRPVTGHATLPEDWAVSPAKQKHYFFSFPCLQYSSTYPDLMFVVIHYPPIGLLSDYSGPRSAVVQ
jgi:hypothetical protein